MSKQKTPRDFQNKTDAENAVRTMFRVCLRVISTVFSIFVTLLLVLIVAGVIVVCAFAIYISNNVDSNVDDILTVSSTGSTITSINYYDENGNLVEDVTQRLSSGKNIMWVSYNDIPDDLVNAFIAIEDKRFKDHHGVDWKTTMGATLKFFIPMGNQRGGSTITQQLIKNTTGDDDYSIQRKVNEIFRALNFEKVKSKEEIMEMYLNIIYLSEGATGVQSAANVYFSKDVSELSLVECAAIASITQNPSRWDPYLYPENNKSRRQTVLDEMLDQGLITKFEYNEAYNAELELNMNFEAIALGTTSWYTDTVIDESIALIADKYEVSNTIAKQMLYSGGYKIITAYDPKVQSILEKYYMDVSDTSVLPTSEVIMPESAMIVADPYTGNILGIVGGRGEKTASRVFNRATSAKRQSGSSIKPLVVYTPAMEYGIIDAGSYVEDVPLNFGNEYKSGDTIKYTNPNGWPKNSHGSYEGRVTLNYAIKESKNSCAVNTLSWLGIDRGYNFLTEKLNFYSLIEAEKKNGGVSPDKGYAIALGGFTYGITLKEMVSGYTIFPSGGVFNQVKTVIEIRDADDNVVIDNNKESDVVISRGTAQMMTDLLRHVITESGGTAYSYMSNIRNKFDVAGKTGTTDSNNDRWFIGFSPYYICGDWIGYDEPQSLSGIVKNGEHCRIWAAVMEELHNDILEDVAAGKTELRTFDDGLLVEATYCLDSGKLITDACKRDPRGSRECTAYFSKDKLPTEACDVHVMVPYCREGRGIASSKCPDSQVTYVGLLNFTRTFALDIVIPDSEYTWTQLPVGVKPYVSSNYPFYYSIYPEDKFPGRSSGTQYNRACPLHSR